MLRKLYYIFLVSLVLCAFFGQNYNAYFNGHYHLLDSGKWVFHAHPYSKTASASEPQAQPAHAHSKMQLLSYELLFSAAFIFVLIFIFSAVLSCAAIQFKSSLKSLRSLLLSTSHPHRGPPVLSF